MSRARRKHKDHSSSLPPNEGVLLSSPENPTGGRCLGRADPKAQTSSTYTQERRAQSWELRYPGQVGSLRRPGSKGSWEARASELGKQKSTPKRASSGSRWWFWDPERSSDLPQVTQLGNGRSRIWTQDPPLLAHCKQHAGNSNDDDNSINSC